MNAVIRNFLIFLVVLGVIGAGIWFGLSTWNRGEDAKWYASPDAGGKRVLAQGLVQYIRQEGAGPSAVFISALDEPSSVWWALQDKLSNRYTAVSYDRAGYGWSGEPRTSRTVESMAEELRNLLLASQVKSPWVLVGHSGGALVALTLAALAPSNVAGIVLIDPVPLSNALFRREFGENIWKKWVDKEYVLRIHQLFGPLGVARLLKPIPDGLSQEAAAAFVGHLSRAASAESSLDEYSRLETSLRSVRAKLSGGSYPKVPAVILCRTPEKHVDNLVKKGLKKDVALKIETLWRDTVAEYSRLLPGSVWMDATESTHSVWHDRPDLVEKAVDAVMNASRPVQK